MTSEKTYFQEDWLQHPDYKDWIALDTHAKTKARCKRCCKSCEFYGYSEC